MSKLMLFGPPGIGKSTTIRQLCQMGIDACDLEDIHSNRLQYFWHSDHAIYGAADLDPSEFKDDRAVITILLTMPTERAYQRRRAKRDSEDPAKAHQPPQQRWSPTGFDYVLYAREGVISALVQLIKLWSHEPVLLTERGQTSR